ncbi:MAG TPA: IS110 family transposase [Gemmataceae bacterium]|jgi:transposase|nr:IS110 family transposase [Gemmataceae bacterium]
MSAAYTGNVSTQGGVLQLAFELGWTQWQLAFTIGYGQKPRQRTIRARDLAALEQEIAKAKKRFQLAGAAPVVSCYEAGRDGFWLHRYLTARGVTNVIVDSASIEVNRRKRRVKSDKLDANKLVTMLLRYHAGEKKVWSVVRAPSVADEDQRQLHRELQELKDDRTRHTNRIKGLLASQGLAFEAVDELLPTWLGTARLWDGTTLGADLQRRLIREYERWQFVQRQILELTRERRRRMLCDTTPHVDMVRRLLGLAGIGVNGAWLLVYEFFAWRKLQNRKQAGALVGLTGTPYQSGTSEHEQGISKAGSKRMRKMLVELAWCWLRWQGQTALSQWYARRFGTGKGAARKIGVVAVARKLFIALWKYLERGEVPAGAKLVDWRSKLIRPKVKEPAA